MPIGNAGSDLLSLTVLVLGTCLFCCIFAFLWNRSGVVYFGLWSMAWLADATALVLRGAWDSTQRPLWLYLYDSFVFVFAVVLLAAAQAGLSRRKANWRAPLRVPLFLPIFMLLAYLVG